MKKISKYIDHTLLKPRSSFEDIKKLCQEAEKFDFASVCILPYFVSYAKNLLKRSPINVGTVIGFPLGAHISAVKIFEAKQALVQGADELDVVMNLAALTSGDLETVIDELKALRALCSSVILKAIIETCYLQQDEIIKLCHMVLNAGFDFVKTSTGFGRGGATIEDVKLMKKTLGTSIGIKASGGIKDYQSALGLIQAGATRIGTSHAVAIVECGD